MARVLFVLSSLGCGGAEATILKICRHLPRDRFEMHLAVLDERRSLSAGLDDVRLHELNCGRARHALGPLWRCIGRVRPDVVFSTAFHVNATLAVVRRLLRRSPRMIFRETIASWEVAGPRLRALRARLGRIALESADAVVCQSESHRDDLSHGLKIRPEKLVVVRNPVEFERIDELAKAELPVQLPGGLNILAVGHLTPEKGYDRLICAFKQLVARRPDAHLWMLGEGPEEAPLRELARHLNIGAHVHLIGFQDNPFPWYRQAALFVLPSYRETASNAMLEAIACGCPVVATNHWGGTREYLGLLGQSHRVVDDLSQWRTQWFTRPGAEVRELAEKHFSLGQAIERYSRLLSGDMHDHAGSRHARRAA